MNLQSLETLKGEDGSVAIAGAMYDHSNDHDSSMPMQRNALNKDSTKSLSKSDLLEGTMKFSKMISHLPDAAIRLATYSNLTTMLMSAASRTLLAHHFSNCMKKEGHAISASQVLSPKMFQIGGNDFVNDSVLFSRSDAISLINNVRSSLSSLFVDANGETTSKSGKTIQTLMKPIETAMTKFGPVAAVNASLKELMNPATEKLTSKVEEFLISTGMNADAQKTMSPKNTPGLRGGG